MDGFSCEGVVPTVGLGSMNPNSTPTPTLKPGLLLTALRSWGPAKMSPLCYQPWSTSLLCYSLGWIRFPSASSAVLILFSLFFPAKLMKWFRIHAGIRCFLTQVCSHQQPSRSLGWTPLCSDAFVSVLYSGWCPWLFWKGPLSKMMFIINNVNATKAH